MLLSASIQAQDTLSTRKNGPRRQLGEATRQVYDTTKKVVRGFDRLDENYIEPQHYDWTVMGQITHTYDVYMLRSSGDDNQSVTFAPDVRMKVGPFVGWRWFFLGYTFELRSVATSALKREIDLSVYSSQVGVDLFWRYSGDNFKIRKISLGKIIDASSLEGMSYDGVNSGIVGVQAYYIFNHGKFSYPAAFSQSTIQKLSCGSWMAGAGYTHNTLSIDIDKLQALADRHLRQEVKLDTGMRVNEVVYHDVSLSVGYGYNWVPKRHWLVAGSLALAVAYKASRGSSTPREETFLGTGFEYGNVNLDGVGRVGVVYNNMRWYAGLSIIAHTNNYRKERFSALNVFGSVNLYAGINFGLKKRYKKEGDPKFVF